MIKIIWLMRIRFLFAVLGAIFLPEFSVFSQNLQVGLPVIEERLRLGQLQGTTNLHVSFMQRPIDLDTYSRNENGFWMSDSLQTQSKGIKEENPRKNLILKPLPVYMNSGFNTGTPYPATSNLVMNKGFQTYITTGVYFATGPLSVQVQPELIFAQNQEYQTGASKSWNTEFIERFGAGRYLRFFPGQSSVRLNFGSFSLGASTENIWWGPGQFNALLFSNNAFSFPHLTFNTRKPAKTFLGTFEGQLIVGKLQGSGLENTNVIDLIEDWRYINGISFSYQPKWIKGAFFGVSRIFQQYESFMGNSFTDYFPIFDSFQKKDQFENGNDSGKFDQEGRDQQITFFGRYVIPNAKAEFYFEYGRRDHAYDWREATLNPEHARAYILGFNKLISLNQGNALLIRSEITQQQESINILVRYLGTGGSLNWSGHGVVRHGFTNFGQMLGPGIGPSSNSQTMELSWLTPLKKLGIKFERLNRHQDYYTANFNDPSEAGRWVDFNLTLLGEIRKENYIIFSQFSGIRSFNYGWLPAAGSVQDFPLGDRKLSFQIQLGLVLDIAK